MERTVRDTRQTNINIEALLKVERLSAFLTMQTELHQHRSIFHARFRCR